MNRLEIKNLQIQFSHHQQNKNVIHGVDLVLPSGKITALVGESGSGKTVTSMSALKILPEEARVVAGQILYVDDEKVIDILSLEPKALQKIRGKDIAVVFQDPAASLDPLFTIGEQILETVLAHKNEVQERAEHRVKIMLRKMGFSNAEDFYHKYPHELSGGQKQRVLLAMALVCKPKVLIADEATTALDVTLQRQVLEILKELKQEMNLAILFVTHDLSLVMEYADYVHVMKDGSIIESAKPREILENPRHDYTQKLLKALPDFFDFPNSLSKSKKILLEAKNLCQSYRQFQGLFKKKKSRVQILDHLDFKIHENEILGIVGESGSGKSTLARVLGDLMPYDKGEIKFESQDIAEFSKKQKQEFRLKVQTIFQEPFLSFNPKMTIYQTLREPLQVHRLVRKSEMDFHIKDKLKLVGLSKDILSRYPHQISGGQCQRVAILRSLLLKPKLLIADEPTSSLDVTIQKQILELLFDLKEKMNLTLVFVSHDLKVVEKFCDRICVMYGGQIVEEIPAAKIQDAKHPYTVSLWNAAPEISYHQKENDFLLLGETPSFLDLPTGCVFHPRCPLAQESCSKVKPKLESFSSDDHRFACDIVKNQAQSN